ncbi:hypothetical protein Q1695_014604 [Nippostrongylus brasiliensis]|nr:hypothetical protein Q1695_014604 [Nippostrongylus brasiliensis]
MKISLTLRGQHFRLLVVGGGASGMGASHKFARKLPKFSVGVVEPNEIHYYQPGFTLVGGGLMPLSVNKRQQKDLIHPKTVWIKDSVAKFEPKKNSVKLSNGDDVTYDYMIICTGVQLRWDLIKGLPEGLDTPGVCSNYSPHHCEKTYKELSTVESGNCIFTFPNKPIKCAGAPQKICYIGDEILRKRGVRDNTHFIYATALGRLFGVEAYLCSLNKVAKKKEIDVKTRVNLCEVDTKNKIAKFELVDENCEAIPGKYWQTPYSVLHVGPPCTPPPPVRECKELTDAKGWLDVDPGTLRSKHFPNVFGAGDCINTGNAKTAAAVSSHLKTIEKNLTAVIEGRDPQAKYDGYASCPLVIGKNKAILAEFNSEGRMETTPVDQSVVRIFPYFLKRYAMPWIYWHMLVKGYWNGPATMRKLLHLGNLLPRRK